MKEFVLVGIGGAIGAMLRYGFGMLPLRHEFPFSTMLINIIGAFFIGLLFGSTIHGKLSNEASLLLKTGVCGGFTTFSTYSLESMQLLSRKQYGYAFGYMSFSIILCLAAVFLGSACTTILLKK